MTIATLRCIGQATMSENQFISHADFEVDWDKVYHKPETAPIIYEDWYIDGVIAYYREDVAGVEETIVVNTQCGREIKEGCVWFYEDGVAVALLNVDSGMFRNPGVDLNIAIKALIILIVSGTLAGLIPAKRAISIKPIDAIRN